MHLTGFVLVKHIKGKCIEFCIEKPMEPIWVNNNLIYMTKDHCFQGPQLLLTKNNYFVTKRAKSMKNIHVIKHVDK